MVLKDGILIAKNIYIYFLNLEVEGYFEIVIYLYNKGMSIP